MMAHLASELLRILAILEEMNQILQSSSDYFVVILSSVLALTR